VCQPAVLYHSVYPGRKPRGPRPAPVANLGTQTIVQAGRRENESTDLACYARCQPWSWDSSLLWLRLEPGWKLAPFPSARNYGTTVYGEDKCGTKEKARAGTYWQGHSDRRAMASRRACGDRCLDRVVKRQNAYSGPRHPPPGRDRAEGKKQMIKPKPSAEQQVADEASRRALNPLASRQAISDSQSEPEFQLNHKRLGAERLAREAGLKGK
jgi:hypothetical protein